MEAMKYFIDGRGLLFTNEMTNVNVSVFDGTELVPKNQDQYLWLDYGSCLKVFFYLWEPTPEGQCAYELGLSAIHLPV